MTKIMALARFHSCPSVFLSVSPDDVHNPRALRLCFRSINNTFFPATDMCRIPGQQLPQRPDESSAAYFERLCQEAGDANLQETGSFVTHLLANSPIFHTMNVPVRLDEEALQRLAGENSVATTELFTHMVECVTRDLLGLPIDRDSRVTVPMAERQRGLFGKTVQHFSVVETSGRLALHFHMLLWGGLTPAMLQLLVQHEKTHPNLLKAVARAAESQYHAEVDASVHVADALRQALHVKATRFAEKDLLDCPTSEMPGGVAPTAAAAAAPAEDQLGGAAASEVEAFAAEETTTRGGHAAAPSTTGGATDD
jgi:hypothetical protein